MKRYLIICEETCLTCGGFVREPIKEQRNVLECHTCGGDGVIRKEVELAEAFDELAKYFNNS